METVFHCIWTQVSICDKLNQKLYRIGVSKDCMIKRLASTAALPCTYRFWLAKLLFWSLLLHNGVSRGAVNAIYHSARVGSTKNGPLDHLACHRVI